MKAKICTYSFKGARESHSLIIIGLLRQGRYNRRVASEALQGSPTPLRRSFILDLNWAPGPSRGQSRVLLPVMCQVLNKDFGLIAENVVQRPRLGLGEASQSITCIDWVRLLRSYVGRGWSRALHRNNRAVMLITKLVEEMK